MYSSLFYNIKDNFTHTGICWDHLAPKEKDAIEFAHRYLNQDPPRMIDKDTFSQEYILAHFGGEFINNQYREDRVKEEYKKLPDMLKRYQVKKDIVVYRGISTHAYEMMIKAAAYCSDTDLRDKGFLATSLVKGRESNCEKKLRIYVPAGTHAVYQGSVNDEPLYYEVDIQHDAHLKIVSRDSVYINCKLLYTA